MKYTVNENASFIANGRIYKPGDEIDSEVFKFKKTLEAAISGGKLKPVIDTIGDEKPGDEKPGDEKSGDEKSGDEKPGDEKPGDEKSGDEKPGDENTITAKKRKAMEKAAVDGGLGNLEEIKSLSDKDLAELLAAGGAGA
jgi:hypothetical protein